MQKRNRRLAVFRLGSFFDFAPHTPLYYYLFYWLSIPFLKLVDKGEGIGAQWLSRTFSGLEDWGRVPNDGAPLGATGVTEWV
jgi:hypothetical protein